MKAFKVRKSSKMKEGTKWGKSTKNKKKKEG